MDEGRVADGASGRVADGASLMPWTADDAIQSGLFLAAVLIAARLLREVFES